MPRVMGKVEGYELGDPELLEQLREDLKRGSITIRGEEAFASIHRSHDSDDFNDTIAISDDGKTLVVHQENCRLGVSMDQRIPVKQIRHIDIFAVSFEDGDMIPLIHWRYEPQFCGPWIYFRTEFLINTRPKDWEREVTRCQHTYETQPEADNHRANGTGGEDVDQREQSRIRRRDRVPVRL